MNRLKSFLFFMFTAILVFSQVSFVHAEEPIDEIRDLIETYYVEDVPASTLNLPTIHEMTKQLDPYSVYMTKQEFERFSNTVNQELIGIGVVLEENEQGVKVIQTIPQGPADQAGIRPGDIITHVNGKSLSGESMQAAVSYMSGEENTFVDITFLQKETGNLITKKIERKRISLPNVEADMLGGEIGYIRLHSFSMNAAEQLQSAIKSLSGAKGYILDLRDNGGGYVSAAQEVTGLFPKVHLSFQLREKAGKAEVYKALPQPTQFSHPIHMLVNENSASASEMVSAAVKEQNGGVLYGQTTYGKGSMQTLFILSDQSVLKLTTAKFFSPKGTAINKVGVSPNIQTNVGEELAVSHRDHLLKSYYQYSKLAALNNVPTTKTFTIKMTTGMNWDALSTKDVQLIQLGGHEVETELTIIDDRTLKVTPKKSLQSNERYLLIIHPHWSSKQNKSMIKGSYLEISVK
ncbi:S41 family peptidase [Cytobacillus massiliigabonensis]|uniref:S41 family peptidase n=1 Tax=Cytobacillus massiliigabonensis TaxID=1871011 RepID=UPI0015E0ADA2